MSMLSAQVDRLRELATRCDELQVGTVRAVRVPLDMGSILREAADTIWQLRDDLQRTNAENAKLREERDHWHVEQVHAYGNWEDAYRRAAELETENAKLRELCKEMMAFVEDDDACEHCGHDAECVEAADGELVLPYEGRCLMLGLFADRMRELGVEVG